MTLHPPRNTPSAAAGNWQLPAGRALALEPRRPGRLHVARGAVWATLHGPLSGQPDRSQDLMLQAGDSLALRRGDRLVMEPLQRGEPAWFRWDPAPVPVRVPAAQALGEPWAQLRAAGGLAGHALVALAAGLVRVALTAARPAAASPPVAGCGSAHG